MNSGYRQTFFHANAPGKMFVLDGINGVPNNAQDVKPRQDGLAEGHAGIVSSTDGIGGGND